MFSLNEIEVNDGELITNMRQKHHIDNAIIALNEAYRTLDEGMPIDISAISIKEILEELGEITGQNVSEDIINEIFSKFCLGK